MNDLEINKRFVKEFGPYPDYLAICCDLSYAFVVFKCAPAIGWGGTEERAWENAANNIFNQLFS